MGCLVFFRRCWPKPSCFWTLAVLLDVTLDSFLLRFTNLSCFTMLLEASCHVLSYFTMVILALFIEFLSVFDCLCRNHPILRCYLMLIAHTHRILRWI